MSVIGSNILAGASGQGGEYTLARSLRFRSSASAYLNRTPASAGNRQTWTWSGWVKRGTLGAQQKLFFAGSSGTSFTSFEFISADTFQIYSYNGAQDAYLVTSQVFRDPSAWYHIVVVFDTTNATSSNRIKVYVNGSQVTAFSTNSQPSQNYQGLINNNVAHAFCRDNANANNYFDGYVAETNFIDGQALTPSSFGETSTTTGVWQPKKYAGTYGTNGFYLPFTDNSALTSGSNAGLGKDFSGNGNYWNTNNISITSGATYDSMTDVPTLTSATASNYCVLNPLSKGTNVSITNANLAASYGSAAWTSAFGTIGVSTGKWYWEITLTSAGTDAGVGISTNPAGSANSYIGGDANSWGYYANNGNKWNNGSSSSYGATYANGDVIGVALDLDAGTLVFYKNNSSQGTAFSSLASNTYFPALSVNNSSFAANFGQRPFAYTPPTGYVALNTFNLPTPTIGATASTQANKYFDATTFTSNNTSDVTVVNAGGFAPDLVWYKDRATGSTWHTLVDRVRGNSLTLSSNQTDQEYNVLDNGYTGRKLVLNSNGFTINDAYNAPNTDAMIGWQWKANGTGVSNTAGSITSTVSANTSSGFSVVTYTGNGTNNATVGHGLGVAPKMVIVKQRNGTYEWAVYHSGLTSGNMLFLNLTQQEYSIASRLNGGVSATSSTTFTCTQGSSTLGNVNASSQTYVAYCFSEVAGYSKFGSYTANASTDGPFTYTGFKPRFVMVKSSSNSDNWIIYDSARETYNVMGANIHPNLSNAEASSPPRIDFLSNGFKIRAGSGFAPNETSGWTYIYAAFAEHPFKYSLGR